MLSFLLVHLFHLFSWFNLLANTEFILDNTHQYSTDCVLTVGIKESCKGIPIKIYIRKNLKKKMFNFQQKLSREEVVCIENEKGK